MVVEISATLFQPARSGSHLYPASLHPMRSRTLSSRSYTTLVGLATPLLPCFPLCTCIIAHIWLLVKYFFLVATCFFSRLLPTPLAVGVLSLATRGWWKVAATPWNRTF